MPKNGKIVTRETLKDRLVDAIDLAAWAKAKCKPNGHLEQGVFFWPKPVQEQRAAIKQALRKVTSRKCRCRSKKERKEHACAAAKRAAIAALRSTSLKRSHKKRIVETIALLAHTKEAPQDDSGE